MVMEYAKGKGLKEYINPKTKAPSADKNARKVWGKEADEFLTVDQLKVASTLKNSFVKPGLVNTDRMYYNLLVHGTGEGRLSSTGKRPRIDLNIQNIPEEVKRIFVPDKGDWWFIDNDIGQGENKLTAWFAQDWERLERLADPEYDEHSETATACFGVGVTKSNGNKHLRKAGKIINHMLNYGAGWKKLQEVLAINGFVFTASECKELIGAWKIKNAGTAAWQERTIAMAGQQGYLENPFGRRRWFQTRDLGPKALAFLPASTLADCVLRMMIAMHADKWGVELDNLRVSDRMVFGGNWRMVTQVHDSIVATGPKQDVIPTWTDMRRVMTQKWEELDGFGFTIESKICRHNLKEGIKVYTESDLQSLLAGDR
jgi:DNA polymerase I-like protein with 3'-5' exonuclease and polymerase domains